MKKNILFLFLLFVSCNIPYDLETRLIIESKLIDSNGVPVVNEEASIFVKTGNSGETICNSYSDENGIIRFIFPKPDVENFTLSLEKDRDELYLDKSLVNIKIDNFNNYKLILNDLKLFKNEDITNLTIQLNQVNTNKEIRKIEVFGNVYNSIEYFNPLNNQDTFYDLQTFFNLTKNQNFSLKYKVYNYSTMLLEENTVNLAVENEPIMYFINY